MSQTTNKRTFLRYEFEEVFKLKPNKRHWSIPLLASLCVGIPMVFGLIINDFSSALTVSLAGLVILYMPANSSFIERMATMLICSFGFMISYGIGITFSFNPLISSLSFGIFSSIIHWISRFFNISPPGNFFFIMLASMASGIPFNLENIPEKLGLIAIGTILACLFALVYSLFTYKKTEFIKESVAILSKINKKKYVNCVEAVIIGFFMFASLFIGNLFDLRNPYWIPISCLAVMQGSTVQHIWRRGFYRILGTIIGMLLCWVILIYTTYPFVLCIFIIILQFIIELFISRNYTLAVVFITPMTILLAETGNTIAQNPTELITSRMIDVLIGSTLGAIGGWFVHHERIRHQAIRKIRMARVVLNKKIKSLFKIYILELL